jgi:predicted outer membrane repeat protein
MKMIRRILPVPLVVGLMLAVALGATPAQAGGVVTDCTETGLANAMNAGGGLITFDCGPDPVVIPMTLQNGGLNVISGRADTIDGGDKVTLSGANAQRLFDVGPNAALTLTNIILTNGYAAIFGNLPDWGGAVLDEGDLLVLDHVTIRDSRSLHLGGAIRVVTGTVFIRDSLLENNESGYGGAIDSLGALSLVNTIVRGNQAVTDSGGGLSLGGLTTIDHSQIYSNIANGADGGGGLYLTAPSVVAITATQITSNTALNPGSPGGGIQNYGALTLAGGSLSGNAASGGGGLSNQRGATATLGAVSLSGNSTSFVSAGGAIFNLGTLTLTNISLIDNLAPSGYGGGLANFRGATATVVNSTFTGNQAGLGGGIQNDAALTLLNDTFSGNMATLYWGGGLHGGPTSVIALTNVTFGSNSAVLGGGAIAFDALSIDSLTLKNTLMADSLAGGNCYVVPGSARGLTSAGFNLSDDASCAADFHKAGDQNNQPARLWPLANNGGLGFTATFLPQHDSLAIDHGAGLGCPAADQRGQPRPAGGACDIGAVEVQPADLAWALFLPLQRR